MPLQRTRDPADRCDDGQDATRFQEVEHMRDVLDVLIAGERCNALLPDSPKADPPVEVRACRLR